MKKIISLLIVGSFLIVIMACSDRENITNHNLEIDDIEMVTENQEFDGLTIDTENSYYPYHLFELGSQFVLLYKYFDAGDFEIYLYDRVNQTTNDLSNEFENEPIVNFSQDNDILAISEHKKLIVIGANGIEKKHSYNESVYIAKVHFFTNDMYSVELRVEQYISFGDKKDYFGGRFLRNDIFLMSETSPGIQTTARHIVDNLFYQQRDNTVDIIRLKNEMFFSITEINGGMALDDYYQYVRFDESIMLPISQNDEIQYHLVNTGPDASYIGAYDLSFITHTPIGYGCSFTDGGYIIMDHLGNEVINQALLNDNDYFPVNENYYVEITDDTLEFYHVDGSLLGSFDNTFLNIKTQIISYSIYDGFILEMPELSRRYIFHNDFLRELSWYQMIDEETIYYSIRYEDEIYAYHRGNYAEISFDIDQVYDSILSSYRTQTYIYDLDTFYFHDSDGEIYVFDDNQIKYEGRLLAGGKEGILILDSSNQIIHIKND